MIKLFIYLSEFIRRSPFIEVSPQTQTQFSHIKLLSVCKQWPAHGTGSLGPWNPRNIAPRRGKIFVRPIADGFRDRVTGNRVTEYKRLESNGTKQQRQSGTGKEMVSVPQCWWRNMRTDEQVNGTSGLVWGHLLTGREWQWRGSGNLAGGKNVTKTVRL